MQMKIADLYVRVSTDEQADKGYSQRNQEEVLKRYCQLNNILVRQVIFEDHSAKTFNRPEWKKLLLNLKKHKRACDLILFTKWDRFSRNAGDAYQMINYLRKLGTEPQAIEQPLDLSVPENKMMLAFYLAAPEVENDRRALNVTHGMRRAKKEGRWMATAPNGYKNVTLEGGKKIIVPDGEQANIMKWVFETIALGAFNTEQVYKMAKVKGLRTAKNAFWMGIRNPVFCGKIFIPAFKDEEAKFVKGQHEAIISEALFYEVQDVLDGKSKKFRAKIKTNEELPLRGFLLCKCGKLMSGSRSRGRSKHYAYYHCNGGCTFRLSAERANAAFEHQLKKYTPKPEYKTILRKAITEAYQQEGDLLISDRKKLTKQIQDLKEKITYTRDLLAAQKIDPEDYREMKTDLTVQLSKLEGQLSGLGDEASDLHTLLEQGMGAVFNLYNIYKSGDTEQKRHLIGSVFPEKFSFENFKVRTARLNEVVRLIYTLDAGFGGNENGTSANKIDLSRGVAQRVSICENLVLDLKRLARIGSMQ